MDSFQDSSSTIDADDNTFYQELTRRILMLTDEDDDDKGVYSNGGYGVAGLEHRPVVGSRLVARSYYSWSEARRCTVPSWMKSLWATGGGGTGVFIPRDAATNRQGKKSGRRRRYNNKATKNNDRGRVYSAGEKIRG